MFIPDDIHFYTADLPGEPVGGLWGDRGAYGDGQELWDNLIEITIIN